MRTASKSLRRYLQKPKVETVHLIELATDFTESPSFTTITYRFAQTKSPYDGLSFAGNTYAPLAFRVGVLRRDQANRRTECDLILDNASLEQSAFLIQTRLAGSRVTIRKTVWDLIDGNESLDDSVVVLKGKVTEVNLFETTLRMRVVSHFTRAGDRAFPKRILKVNCNHRLGDDACTIDLTTAANTVDFTAQEGSTKSRLVYDSGFEGKVSGSADVYFVHGYVVCTAGVNKGWSRRVVTIDTVRDEIFVRTPFPFTPDAGDTFNVVRGCGKTIAECNRFNNSLNYGGYKEVPRRPRSPVNG